MRHTALITSAWLMLAGIGMAGAEPLDLHHAMAVARERANAVAAAQGKASAAQARLQQAKGHRLPSLGLQEIWTRTDSPAEAFAFKLNQARFSFAEFTSSDPNHPSALDTAMTRAELTLPLYTGGELAGRIGQAELAANAARDDASWAADQAALDAAEAYVAVEEAREQVEVLEKARDTVRAHVELARQYVAQGMLVRSDLLRAEVELARVEDLLAQAQGGAKIAAANLAFRLGADQATQFELVALPPSSSPAGPLQDWLATADGRKDLIAAREQLKAAQLEESVRSAAWLPRVGLVGRADWFDDRLFGANGKSSTIMAVASVNLFAGGSDRAARAAARWDARAGAAQVVQFEQAVHLSVRQAYQEATTAHERELTATRALDAAAEGARITEERFKAGVVKMLDLLDADTARREAQERALVARADALASVLRLALLAGRAPESVLP
jgi:outer membrane protein